MQAEKNLLIYPDFGHEGPPGASDRVFDLLAQLEHGTSFTRQASGMSTNDRVLGELSQRRIFEEVEPHLTD
jgi:hypothetical protein